MPITLYRNATTTTEPSLDSVALSATLHCLTGCSIGEVLGMIIGTAPGFFDNAIMLLIPGAMDAGLDDVGFYAALTAALIIAGAAAFPVNRRLIRRGKGHAVVHQQHTRH